MSLQRTSFFAIGFMLLCFVVSVLRGISAPSTPAAMADLDRSTQTVTPSPEAQTLLVSRANAAAASTSTPAALPSETPDRYADLRGTQTALGLEKEQLDQEEVRLRMQILSDGTTSTAAAQVTSTAIAAAQSTSVAQTAQSGAQSTGTQHAIETQTSMPLTVTAIVATQQVETIRLQVSKAQAVAWPLLLGLLSLTAVVASTVLAWRYTDRRIAARFLQESQIVPDPQGRFPAVPEGAIPGKSKRVINPNAGHRAVIDPDHDDLTPEQALENTSNLRALEATRAIAQSPALLRQALRTKPVTTVAPGLPDANLEISRPPVALLGDRPLAAPSWSVLESWDGQGPIPYGVSTRGIERVSLQQIPHGGIFGMTGKGKSRYFLRPFIAAAIAAGQRVVILGKQADFWPFANHPNVTMIPIRHITQVEEADRYAGYLKRIVEEMNRRDDYLTAHQVSTWDRAGRENTLVVLDELGNALDMMPRDVASEAYRWVSGLVREGRKAGFNVWLASQRAVGFKSIVEQLGRAVFYLSDADASRYALGMPGAETLSDGHFFAKFQGVRQCAAFDPSDDQLVTFLQHRSVPAREPIDWIEAEVTDVHVPPVVPEAPAPPPADPEEQQIREILLRMDREDKVSLRQVEQEVWGRVRGGQYFSKVQTIWKQMKSNGTTTIAPDMPESGTIAA